MSTLTLNTISGFLDEDNLAAVIEEHFNNYEDQFRKKNFLHYSQGEKIEGIYDLAFSDLERTLIDKVNKFSVQYVSYLNSIEEEFFESSEKLLKRFELEQRYLERLKDKVARDPDFKKSTDPLNEINYYPNAVIFACELFRSDLIIRLERTLKNIKGTYLNNNHKIQGKESRLSVEQLDEVYNEFIRLNYFTKKGNKEHFLAIFKNEEVPDGWDKINFDSSIRGSKVNLYGLMMIAISDTISPSDIGDYFRFSDKPLDSNNKYVKVLDYNKFIEMLKNK